MNRTCLAWLGAALLLWSLRADARQSEPTPGDKLLAAVDSAVNRADTLYLEFEISNQEPGKAERTLAQRVWVKGGQRLIEFTAPADMKGTKLLVLSPTQVYVYLPAFGKVRRVASSSTDGFMGLAFPAEHFFVTRLSEEYTANLGPENALVLTPKSGKNPRYAKIEMTVLKEESVPGELKYYDAEGTLLRTELRSGYTKEGAVAVPGEIKVTDATKNGLTTRLLRKALKVNEPIAEDVFSKRALEK